MMVRRYVAGIAQFAAYFAANIRHGRIGIRHVVSRPSGQDDELPRGLRRGSARPDIVMPRARERPQIIVTGRSYRGHGPGKRPGASTLRLHR